MCLLIILIGCGGGSSKSNNNGGNAIKYTLTISVEGSGTVTPESGTTYASGIVVELIPIGNNGYALNSWSGTDGASVKINSGKYYITMDGNKNITAIFSKLKYDLTINISPGENAGSVTNTILSTNSNGDNIIQLNAVPKAGYTFSQWSGDITGTDNPTTLTLDSAKSVTATFTRAHYILNTSVSPSGAGTAVISPAQSSYEYGDSVQITATANSGYQFSYWKVGDSTTKTDNPLTLSIDSTETITAVFVLASVAYVVNENSNTISAYYIGLDGSLSLFGTYSTGSYPKSIAVDPSKKYVYVTNWSSNNISAYSIGSNGSLTLIGTYNTANYPESIAVDPNGKFIYVTFSNTNLNTVSVYSLGSNGSLSLINTYSYGNGYVIAVHPSGQYLYVTNQNSNKVMAFRIDTSGSLTYIAEYSAYNSPDSIIVEPSGKYVYVVDNGKTTTSSSIHNGGILVYSILSNGGLEKTDYVIDETGPESIAVTPSGKYIYFTKDSLDISAYSIGSNGSLTKINNFYVGDTLFSLTVDPNSKYLYITETQASKIIAYNIDSNGGLSLIGKYSTGTYPRSLVVVKRE